MRVGSADPSNSAPRSTWSPWKRDISITSPVRTWPSLSSDSFALCARGKKGGVVGSCQREAANLKLTGEGLCSSLHYCEAGGPGESRAHPALAEVLGT